MLDGRALIEKLIGLKCLSRADRAARAVAVPIAVKQIAVAVGSVATAVAPQLRQKPGILLRYNIGWRAGPTNIRGLKHWTIARH